MRAFLDWIFPTEERATESEEAALNARESKQLRAVSESTAPEMFANAYDMLLADEKERLKSVENRLEGVLRLTPITATLVVGGMMALVNAPSIDGSRSLREFAGFGVVYLSLQIICSTLAAVRGLARATWLRPDVGNLIKDPHKGSTQIDRERAIGACKRYHAIDRNINSKVTQMAIAHTAIRNFAVGSAMIAMLGLFAIVFRTPAKPIESVTPKNAEPQQSAPVTQGQSRDSCGPGAAAPMRQPLPNQVEPTVGNPGKTKTPALERHPTEKQ